MSHTLLEEPQWNYFFNELQGPNGCDFKEEPKKDNPEETHTTWRCKGGMDKSFAAAILAKMDGVSTETGWAVLTYVESLGGHCDCEIIFNAVERIYEHIDREAARA